MREKPIIAIDGPSGAGKTTIAKQVARALGFMYIDTGAMYRCVALAATRHGLIARESHELRLLLNTLTIRFQEANEKQKVFLDDEEVTEEIRQHDVSQLASEYSALLLVRTKMVGLQRSMARNGGVVMEGRDIGNNVFPDAELKVFLTASAEVRARRRYRELWEMGQEVSLDKILADQVARDKHDSTRAVNPLVQAPDAWLLDTSNLTIDEIVIRIVKKAKEIQMNS